MSGFNCGLCGSRLRTEGQHMVCKCGYYWPERKVFVDYPPWLVGLQWFLGALLVFKIAEAALS